MICCQGFFNTERRDGESFLFGDSKRKKKREGKRWDNGGCERFGKASYEVIRF